MDKQEKPLRVRIYVTIHGNHDTMMLLLSILLVLSAVAAIKMRHLIHAVVALAVFSLALSTLFYLLHAPDVAIAEAAVGAGISTTVFVLATVRIGRREE